MSFTIGIIVVILMLGPMIIIHELGHYIAALIFRVKALEFGLGFPPRAKGIWTGRTKFIITPSTLLKGFDDDYMASGSRMSIMARLRASAKPGDDISILYADEPNGDKTAIQIRAGKAKDADMLAVGQFREVAIADGREVIVVKDMLWSLNWLFLGGYVKMRGEDDPKTPDSLASKPRLARICVLGAGVAMNILLAFVLFTAHSMTERDRLVGDVVIQHVMPNSPAAEAGMRTGDRIIEVNGEEVLDYRTIVQTSLVNLGDDMEWVILRGYHDPFAGPGGADVPVQRGRT